MMPRVAALALAAAGILLSDGVEAQSRRVAGQVTRNGAGVTNAVVALYPLEAAATAPSADTATVDQVHLRFVPQVLAVTPGTTVWFANSDPLMHNVFGPGSRGGDVFDLGTYPIGTHQRWLFRKVGIHTVLCHIHPEMVAYVVVVDTPYRAVTREDGTFSIEGVAPGRYRALAVNPARSRQEAEAEIMVRDNVEGLVLRLDRRRSPGGAG